MSDLTDNAIAVVIAAVVGLLTGILISWGIAELIWLFSPEGIWFNSDTIPLQTSIELLFDALVSPWTYVVFWPVGIAISVIVYKIYDF